MKGYRRRNYFTDRRFQGKFVFSIIVICAVGLFLSLTAFNYFSYTKLDGAIWRAHLDPGAVGKMIRPYLLYSNLAGFALTMAALLLLSRIMLQRTAFPLFRLKRFIEFGAEGNLNLTLDWMADDEFAESASELNAMTASVRGRFGAIKEKAKRVDEVSAALSYVLDKPDVSAEKCKALLDGLHELKAELSRR